MVITAYIKSSAASVALQSEPEPMDIDVIELSGDRRRATIYWEVFRTGQQSICLRCQKPGTPAPAPTSAHAVDVRYEGTVPTARPKNGQDQ